MPTRSNPRRRLLRLLAFLALLAPGAAQAEFSDRPIRIIVPFAPAGASDLIARVLSAPLAEALGQPVVVENHAGANGNIGIDYAAKADPDGHTLLVASSVIFVNHLLRRPGSHDPEKEFAPITELGGSPNAILTRADSRIDSLDTLMKLAKAEPGRLTYASPGVGSISQLGIELLDVRTGIKLVHVPFTGAGPAVQAALGGTTDLGAVAISAAIPLVKAGKLRALVQTGSTRWFELTDVPTLADAGVRDAESETLQVLLAPANTPPAAVARISAAVTKILGRNELRQHLLQTGFAVTADGPEALKKVIAAEVGKWRTVITEAKLKVE